MLKSDLLTNQVVGINTTEQILYKYNMNVAAEPFALLDPELYQISSDQDLLRAALLWCPAAPQDLITKLRYVVDNALLVDSFLERFTLVDPVSHKVQLRPDVLRSVDWAATDFHLLWHRAEVYESVCEEAALKVPKDKLDPLATPAVTQHWTRHLVGRAAADLRVYRGLAALASLVDRNRGWAKCGVACARLLLILLEGLAWTTADQPLLLQVFAAADTVVQRLHSVHTDEERLVKTQLLRRLDALRQRHTHTATTRTTTMDEETTGLISAHTEDLQSRKLKFAALYEAKHAKTMARLVRKKQSFYDSAAEETKSVIEAIMAAGRSTGELRCPLTNEVIDQSQVYYLTGQLHVSSAVLNQARHRTASQRLEACMQDASERMDVGLYEKLREMVGKLGNHEYLGHEQTVIATCKHFLSADQTTFKDSNFDFLEQHDIQCPICRLPYQISIPIFPLIIFSVFSAGNQKAETRKLSSVVSSLMTQKAPAEFIECTKLLFEKPSMQALELIIMKKLDFFIDSTNQDLILKRKRALMKLSNVKGFGETIRVFSLQYAHLYTVSRIQAIARVYTDENPVESNHASVVSQLQPRLDRLRFLSRIFADCACSEELTYAPLTF